MKKNLLVTLADSKYIPQAKQFFSSVYFNADWKGDCLLLSHDLVASEINWFRERGIFVHECKPIASGMLGEENEYPAVVTSELHLFKQEFKKWRTVVFLDSDIIVRKNLNVLSDVKKFGAVEDIGTVAEQFYNNGTELFSKLKKQYDLTKPSLNSGVIAFNTDIIQEGTFSKLRGLFLMYVGICKYPEQSILNLFFRNWEKFPKEYNMCINLGWDRPNPKDAAVLHFAGGKSEDKPWHPQNPFFKEWKNNLARADSIQFGQS